MARLKVVVPAQEFEYDLDGYEEDGKEHGAWSFDFLYDGWLHNAKQQVEYSWSVED